MNQAHKSNFKTHVEKLNPTSRTDLSNKTLRSTLYWKLTFKPFPYKSFGWCNAHSVQADALWGRSFKFQMKNTPQNQYFPANAERMDVHCLESGCIGKYIPPLGSVRIHYLTIFRVLRIAHWNASGQLPCQGERGAGRPTKSEKSNVLYTLPGALSSVPMPLESLLEPFRKKTEPFRKRSPSEI